MTTPGQHELQAGDAADVLNPPTGFYALWVDTNGVAFLRNSAGADVQLGASSGGAFGEEYQYAADEDVSTMSGGNGNSAGAFEQKLRLAASVQNGHKYLIQWTYMWNHDSASNNFEARIQLDDADTIFEQDEEPADSGGNWESTGSDQKLPVSGFKEYTASADGTLNIDLDWRSEDGGTKASIWGARITIWRVS